MLQQANVANALYQGWISTFFCWYAEYILAGKKEYIILNVVAIAAKLILLEGRKSMRVGIYGSTK